ncbi:hypothetical protein C8T65DRAFT_803280 [Cerioporus squamosus]|nr:hypothetical protein C8T65DRAFT_803280 [Cerioporus squamosus]
MPSHIARLSTLATRLADYKQRSQEEDDFDAGFIALLTSIVDVVRDAEDSGAPDLADIVNKAGSILDGAIDWAYGDGDFDFLKSYAHSNNTPLVRDSAPQPFGERIPYCLKAVSMIVTSLLGPLPQTMRDEIVSSPWTASYRPHPKSTRLSHFRNGVNTSATDATPIAQAILQARCEILSDDFPCPVNSAIAADSSALTAGIAPKLGGWKHRDPVLSLYILDETEDNDGDEEGQSSGRDSLLGRHYRSVVLEPGLSEVAYQVAMDTPRKLAFVADSSRIKSFYWGRKGEASFKNWAPARGTNVHTFDSRGGHDGPIAMLPGGRLTRAGKGSFAVWDTDKMPTHKGGKRVGKGKFKHDSWRDNECDEIELSTGSKPTSIIKLADKDQTFVPAVLTLHEPSGHMLAGENARKTAGRYGCYALDLVDGGKKVARYLGHGGFVEAFSVSPGDASVFATGCSDGYARLYDVRHPTPVMTLDAGKSGEFCSAVQLVHPDGIPVVFTGGERSQSIKTWDIRARAMVYELATGNNAVRALSWDAKRNALYAATECDYMDRNGYHHGYRRARIPKWARLYPEEAGEDDDEDMDDEEYDSDDDDSEENWPENAYHSEDSFGYAYDAGEHTLLRYGFKEDPDMRELPIYGQATLEHDGGYW